ANRTSSAAAASWSPCREAQRGLGRGHPQDASGTGRGPSVSAFLDTNILIRHLTGDPPQMAARATAYLGAGYDLYLTDLVVAETIYVLESFYEVPRPRVADAIRSLLALVSMIVVDRGLPPSTKPSIGSGP